MKIKLNTVRGVLLDKRTVLCKNDALRVTVESPLPDLFLNWNGETYRVVGGEVLIPSDKILNVNIVAVHKGERKWNCGRFFVDWVTTEKGEIADSEGVWQRKVEECEAMLAECREQLAAALKLQSSVDELTKKVNTAINGNELF